VWHRNFRFMDHRDIATFDVTEKREIFDLFKY